MRLLQLSLAARFDNEAACRLLVGHLNCFPSQNEVRKSRNRLKTVLLCARRQESVLFLLPKDVLRYILLAVDGLQKDAAVILLMELNGLMKADSISLVGDEKILLRAVKLIVEHNKPFLQNIYDSLSEDSRMKSLFNPSDLEQNFTESILEVLRKRIRGDCKLHVSKKLTSSFIGRVMHGFRIAYSFIRGSVF